MPVEWLKNPDIRPFVFVRPEGQIIQPGFVHQIDWFPDAPMMRDPIRMDSLNFANLIFRLESHAFASSNMQMPRWVFYDCAVMPGFVAGFAQRTSTLSENLKQRFAGIPQEEWTPLSLFIIIPTMAPFEWVAHNLCTVNSFLPRDEAYPALGFLSKAFGLWYANVEVCCGMTQWRSPALRLHSHYGHFEVLTAYTPIHTHSHTLTYRVKVDATIWERFFTGAGAPEFHQKFKKAGFEIDPTDETSMRAFQSRIENAEGPYFLDAQEVKSKKLEDSLSVYCPRGG